MEIKKKEVRGYKSEIEGAMWQKRRARGLEGQIKIKLICSARKREIIET